MADARPLRAAAVAVTVAALAAFAVGCTSTPSFENLEAIGATSTATEPPVDWPDDLAAPSRYPSAGRARLQEHDAGPGVTDGMKDNLQRKRRLERRQDAIEAQAETLDRQVEAIDMRQNERMPLNASQRYRDPPTARLLKRERRGLEAARDAVQRDLDRLEFERRINEPPPDPFGSRSR